MDIQRCAQEFCDRAFGPFGVDTAPYAAIIAELIEGAVAAERERCAKIADQVAINCARRAAEHTRLDAIASARDKQFSAEEVAHKIRGTWVEA